MASFDENGKYIKTNWKAGDKITATKLNKIEESIEAVNDNDISRHVEADARLDALEAKGVAHDEEFTNVKNTIANNKAAAELGGYEINSRMTFLEQELEEAVAEVNNVAETVDGKIAQAEANMTSAVNQGKADMEAMVAEVEGELESVNSQLAHIAITPLMYGALGKNADKDTQAFKRISNLDVECIHLLIPPGYEFWLNESVNFINKKIIIEFKGKIVDKFVNFNENKENTSLTGKGILCFENCSIQISGSKHIGFDGSYGDSMLSSENRNFLYLYNCSNVLISNMNTINHTGSFVVGINTHNVTHINSSHFGGEFTVLYTRGNDILIDNVTVTNAKYNAIIVENRGFFDDNVVPYIRPEGVTVRNCNIKNTTSINNYAVGLTIDYCDNFICDSNTVDGNNNGTMLYSFADSKDGVISNNMGLNLNNKSNGVYTYCGIGMELDRVYNINASNNTFKNVLTGYLIADSTNVYVDGLYENELTKTTTISTGAGKTGFVRIANLNKTSCNINIKGCVNGGNHGVIVDALVDELKIDKLELINPLTTGIYVDVDSKIEKLYIRNSIMKHDTCTDFIRFWDNTVKVLNVDNVEGVCGEVLTNKRFFFGECENGEYSFRNIKATKFDQVINIPYDRVKILNVIGVELNDNGTNDFVFGNGAQTVTENIRVNGVVTTVKGNNNKVITKTSKPTQNAKFIGQITIDTTNKIIYIAVSVGNGENDWLNLN